MKILHLNDYSIQIGGAERYISELLRAQKERGDNVSLLATNSLGGGTLAVYGEKTKKVWENVYQAEGVTSSARIKRSAWQLFNGAAYRKAREALREFSPDLVHVHMYLGQLSPAPVRLVRRSGLPLVMTAHTYRPVCPVGSRMIREGEFCNHKVGWACARYCSPGSAAHAFLQRVIYGRPDRLFDIAIAPGSAMQRALQIGGFRNVRLMPYGATILPAQNPVDAAENRNITYIGRLERLKGADFLVKAAGRVLPSFKSTRLIICGDGPQRSQLEQLAHELLPPDSYVFTGWLDEARLADIRAKAAFQCVPSIWPENSPLAVYEALSAGLPVLGTRIGGIPDLVRDDKEGLLCDPASIEDLGRCIEIMLCEPDRRSRYAEAALKRADEFTMKKHVSELEKIYQEYVLKKHKDKDLLTESNSGGTL